MSNTKTGKIIEILPTESGTSGNLTYLLINGKINISLLINGKINISSAWKITNANDTETALAQAKEMIDTAFPPAGDLNNLSDDDGLPF